jgi:hypothetical protein
MEVFVHIPTDKNPVTIGPLLSENGLVRIPGKEIRRRLLEVQREYPMDYGALADLETEPIAIEVESTKSLQRRVDGIKHFYPDDALRLRAFGSKAVLLAQHIEVVTLHVESFHE